MSNQNLFESQFSPNEKNSKIKLNNILKIKLAIFIRKMIK